MRGHCRDKATKSISHSSLCPLTDPAVLLGKGAPSQFSQGPSSPTHTHTIHTVPLAFSFSLSLSPLHKINSPHELLNPFQANDSIKTPAQVPRELTGLRMPLPAEHALLSLGLRVALDAEDQPLSFWEHFFFLPPVSPPSPGSPPPSLTVPLPLPVDLSSPVYLWGS